MRNVPYQPEAFPASAHGFCLDAWFYWHLPGCRLSRLRSGLLIQIPRNTAASPMSTAEQARCSFEELFNASAFGTNLLFLHRGVLPPKSGIGHHYHNQMEEMFVILDNEAQFTIDGRTSEPDRSGRRTMPHGPLPRIYNPTERPTQWRMNIAVSSVKAKYDNFDLMTIGPVRPSMPNRPSSIFVWIGHCCILSITCMGAKAASCIAGFSSPRFSLRTGLMWITW